MNGIRVHDTSPDGRGLQSYMVVWRLPSDRIAVDFSHLDRPSGALLEGCTLTSEAVYEVLCGHSLNLTYGPDTLTIGVEGDEVCFVNAAERRGDSWESHVSFTEFALAWNLLSGPPEA